LSNLGALRHLQENHADRRGNTWRIPHMSTPKLSTRFRNSGYWTATGVTAFVFLSGGAAYLAGASFAVAGVVELGYPAYFVTLLGFWKTLGGLAVLAPRFPRVKEWAYAGMAFDLTAAAVSHAAAGHPTVKVLVPLVLLGTGHPTVKVLVPLVLLGIVAASWALRPTSRKLGAEPEPVLAAAENRREPCPTAG
jgi:hypothetical protein